MTIEEKIKNNVIELNNLFHEWGNSYTSEPKNQTKSIRMFFRQNKRLNDTEEFQIISIDIANSKIETLLETHTVIGIEPIKSQQKKTDRLELPKDLNINPRKLDKQEIEVLKKLNSNELKKDIASYFKAHTDTLTRWTVNRLQCIELAESLSIECKSLSIIEIKQKLKQYFNK